MNFGDLPEELRNKSTAELAAILPVMTSGPIKTSSIITWLREQKLATLVPGNNFEGALVDAQAISPEVDKGLKKFLGYLITPGFETMSTHTPAVAVEAATILGVLKQANVVTDEQIAAFYALDGGLPYKDETEATIAAAKTAWEAEQAAQTLSDELEAIKAHVENELISPATTKDLSCISRNTSRHSFVPNTTF